MGRGSLPVREAVKRPVEGPVDMPVEGPEGRRRQLLMAAGLQAGLWAGAACWAARVAHAQPSGAAAAPGAAADGSPQQRRFSGRAVHAETGQWLYTEQHQQTLRNGRWVGGTIRYVSPQGQLLGEKKLEFLKDRYVPVMRTVYPLLQEEEAITEVADETVTMETIKAGQRKTREVARVPGLAVDSGFHVFVQEKLEELSAGRAIQMQLGVISQFDHFRFRIRRAEGATAQVIRLLVEADSMLRLLVPSVKLAYDLRSRDMLEYEGISNLLDPQTRKAPVVRIVYDYATS